MGKHRNAPAQTSETCDLCGCAPRAPDRDELRLAVVLNGGVSLAIWMSGAVTEIDQLRTHSNSDASSASATRAIYAEICEALSLDVTVDVVCGASAGGLNGVFLASAVASGTTLGGIRELWLENGDLSRLLCADDMKNPSSLLDGDSLISAISDKLTTILETKDDSGGRVRLIVTGTDVYGVQTSVSDHFEATLYQRDHRVHFQFAHEPRGASLLVAEDALEWADLTKSNATQLALAGRASSSFPFAFAPARVGLPEAGLPWAAGTMPRSAYRLIGAEDEIRPAAHDRFVMDGGVLDNSPVAALLKQIQAMPAGCAPVERAIVFVVPHADTEDTTAVPADPEPDVRRMLSTAVNVPRDTLADNQIDELRTYLRDRKGGQHGTGSSLLDTDPETLSALATDQYKQFYRLRRITTLNLLAARAVRSGRTVRVDGKEFRRPAEIGKLVEAIRAVHHSNLPAELAWLPDALTGDPMPADETWPWGHAVIERSLLRMLDRVRTARAQAKNKPGAAELRAAQMAQHDQLADYRTIKAERVAEEWRCLQAGTGVLTLDQLVCISNSTWTPKCMADSRAILLEAAKAFITASKIKGLPHKARRELLRERIADLSPEGFSSHLIAADITARAIAGVATEEREIDVAASFMRLSALTRTPFDTAGATSEPAAKLYGMQLGHFASFVRTSWRANDLMWGRLDGASRMVDLLLTDDRVKAAQPHALTIAAARLGVAPATAPGGDDASGDAWRAVFRDALQRGILSEELVPLASCYSKDVKAGFSGAVPPSLAAYLAVPAPADSDPAPALSEYLAWLGGADAMRTRVYDERRSVSGSNLVIRAFVVSSNFFTGRTGGWPAGVERGLRLIRWLVRHSRGWITRRLRKPPPPS